MYYNKDVWDFISPNKPTVDRSIELGLNLCLYYLRDGNTWYSVDEYNAEPGVIPIPWQDVIVTVVLDNAVIYTGSPAQLTQLQYCFQDSTDAQSRVFEISLQGISDKHTPAWPGTREFGSVALRVQGYVDHIPLNLLMPKFGKYHIDTGEIKIADDIMCENGHQRWEIALPFYTWLHQNRDQIIWELTAKK